ncbi:Pentatricopeptide repeat, partial [Dillenia turbinata]
MEEAGVQPDSVTVVGALSACANLGCIEIGKKIYDLARENTNNIIVGNAWLDIDWSTMIVGYAINGKSEKALDLLHRMQSQQVQPNYVTFLGVLSACSHSGWKYFNYMVQSSDKNIKLRKEHYACRVDRSGHLEETYDFIGKMPIKPDPGIWGCLLGACAIHNNVNLGQHVADIPFALAPDIASYHVLLSNMYATVGKWYSVDQ